MCLLFLYLNDSPKPDGYRLILANNRDEFYNRRTDTARWIWDGSSTIGGTDQSPGKEGGTWMAMNRNGKIAVLLNILQPSDEVRADAQGRGFLVRDYVQGSDDPLTFLTKLYEDKNTIYNGYLLVTLDVSTQGTRGAFYTNMSSDPPQTFPKSTSPGVLVFGNSPPVRLWQKAEKGRDLFEGIVGTDPTISQRDRLVREIFCFLKDPRCYELDDQIMRQGRTMTPDDLRRLNSVFVSIPRLKYGTRSHTLALVDASGNAEYLESSMKEPISLEEGVAWIDVCQKFTLED